MTSLRYLDPHERTVPTLLARQAERYGDRPLVTVAGASLSYRDAPRAAERAAATLARAGVESGDRVAAMLPNRIELLELVLGCTWLGAVAVPLNTAARGAQLEHMLTNCGARLLVVEPSLVDRLEAFPPPPALERVWVLDGEQTGERGYRIEPAPSPDGAAPVFGARPQDTAVIIYTSGTTGPSKGVCIPQAALYWWGINVAELLEVSSADVLLNPMPLFHINALSTPLTALVAGAGCVIEERFSASRYWDRARETGATVAYLLGAMVGILASRPPDARDRDHCVALALAPGASAEQTDAFRERFGVRLVQGYASTETNCALGARVDEQRPGMLGRALPGFEARVVDEVDAPVPDGVPGELVLRHREPFAFATGYFGMPEQTLAAWRNLWFHTGDQVVRTPDGWYRFLDRLTDSIRRRGENISSFEVEAAIAEHDAVAAVAAFAVPSSLGDDEVMVAVVLAEGARLSPAELVAHCAPRLAHYAIPRYVDIVDALPMTANGKVRKALLRERGVTPTTWDREASGEVLAGA